ncbi:hypothetical protein L210DRAFT_987512 [Boletus edulis BED1]|uniref:Uncharacterized protein n=1 Tax=Boletus edulis BED1 TaxID=1328754 RepID=A0AAD4BXQ3_BOLED|nr:hypothetical protein L210DRAFT_987512 [Boletus edulis BED1]
MAKPAAPRTPSGKGKKDGSAKKTPKVNKENEDRPVKKARVTVHWTKPGNHHIMDTLLTLIEDSVIWKGAFGFNKGAEKDTTPTGKGKSIMEHCSGIAKVLFTTSEKDSEYTDADLVHLRGVVKNRVMSLKGTYIEYRNNLGETGHGLIISGREDELHIGSEMANVYDEIKSKFLWYLRSHALMGSSPIVCRKSISNSKSDIDLTVLGGGDGGDDEDEDDQFARRTPTPMEDDDAPRGSSRPPSRQGSISDNGDEEDDTSPLKLRQVPLSSKRAADTQATLSSVKKRKTPQDFMKEMADAECEARLLTSAATAKEKTKRERIKRQTAHDTAITVEQMRIEAQEKQAIAARAHELMMMDRQIELARIHAGHAPLGPIDPRLQG